MGWQTTLYTTIRFNRKTYTSKYEVERDLEDARKRYKEAKSKLFSLVTMTEPRKFAPDDYTPMEWLEQEFDNTFEELTEAFNEKSNLEILLEEWDSCHDEKTGLAIPLLKPLNKKDKHGETVWIPAVTEEDIKEFACESKSFLDGDFVPTIYEDKKEL